MPHGIVAQASEQVAAVGPPRTSPLSSSHFTASRLLANRPERASWSPPVSGEIQSQRNSFNGATTTTTKQHLTHKPHAEFRADQRAQPTNHDREMRQATNGRRRWKRDSSHELSLSPSSSSLDELDDDQERETDKSMQTPAGGGPSQPPPLGASSSGKPHVGPMGIFFKVWSLVKVTKARHNKMKRQHSEDAGCQMHHVAVADHQSINTGTLPFNSSLSSAAAASGHQTHLTRQAHILQDGHFRRAGSQPPPSSHLPAIGLGHSGGHPLVSSGDNSAGESTNPLLQATTTGTNGSSSGVSSTTSSTIAANSFANGDGRDQIASSGLSQQRGQQQPPNNASRGSWASRMKRSGADEMPVQTEGSAYVSRYRFRGGDPDQRQRVGTAARSPSGMPAGTETATRQSAPMNVLKQQQIADSKRHSRAHSEAAAAATANQLEELRRQRSGLRSGEPAKRVVAKPKLSLLHMRGGRGHGPRLPRDSISDEDWAAEREGEGEGEGEEGEEEDQRADEEDERRTLTDEAEEEDDSDLNDIYSTPNDSIQSVPSGGRLPETTNHSQTTQQFVSKRAPLPSYQMTKSFSANNFNPGRLAHHHHHHHHQINQQQQTGQSNIKRIDENKILGSVTRLDSSVKANDDNDDDDDDDNNMEQHQEQQVQAASRTERSSNGSSSRFFISSSSSEDSNTPQQRHSSSTSTVRNRDQPIMEPVPLNVGLHYHAPPARSPTRPESLLIPMTQPQLSQQQQHAPNLMTPSALIMNGLGGPSASVAAMSPMFPPPVQGASIFAVQQHQHQPSCQLLQPTNYKKSPSLFEMSSGTSSGSTNLIARFSSRYPCVAQQPRMAQPAGQPQMSSFIGTNASRLVAAGVGAPIEISTGRRFVGLPHSISLHDCKLTTSAAFESGGGHLPEAQTQRHLATASPQAGQDCKASEYKLAQMLLELGRSHDSTGGGGGPALKDARGYTALMHAIISENLSAIKCLIEHGVDLNEINNEGQSALDLVCAKQVISASDQNLPLEMMKLLIEHQVDLDRARESDGSRLLDRLIGQHDCSSVASDKLAFIDCLLHNGAKLGSATWAAASGKHEVQLRLLRKLCQDGYFLYKKSAIEAAVYRFEYALKRIAGLEQQLDDKERLGLREQRLGPSPRLRALQGGVSAGGQGDNQADQQVARARAAVQQVKYQTFLGLSRCERKRRFFKRALEFAHMSILVDSTSYEGYYSKAHILKDLGEVDDALLAIDQTERLVVRSMEMVKSELCDLKNQQESIVFDGCFQVRHDPQRARWLESSRAELDNTLDYLLEAKKHIAWLRAEILDDKKR